MSQNKLSQWDSFYFINLQQVCCCQYCSRRVFQAIWDRMDDLLQVDCSFQPFYTFRSTPFKFITMTNVHTALKEQLRDNREAETVSYCAFSTVYLKGDNGLSGRRPSQIYSSCSDLDTVQFPLQNEVSSKNRATSTIFLRRKTINTSWYFIS